MNDYRSFVGDGFFSLGSIISKKKCQNLLNDVNKNRKISENIFLSEEEFCLNPRWNKVNPGPGICNLAEKFDLDFIEKHEIIVEALAQTLGEKYRIELKKFIMGVPEHWIPDWVLKALVGSNNLNPFIKEEFRDITYYVGAEYHQDIIDYSGQKELKSKSFIVMYVYLDKVDDINSPLYVVPQSHKFGATIFPHDIIYNSDETVTYSNGKGKSERLKYLVLKGSPGTVNLWHSLTLHKTIPIKDQRPRISLKYVIEKDSSEKTLIDELDSTCLGELVLDKHRSDL